MRGPPEGDGARVVRGTIPVSHRYTAGIAGERFFRALAERGVFLATRCAACQVTYCPTRSFCERCFAELSEDVEAGPGGRLMAVTTVRIGLDGQALAEPVTIGLVRLDGADTVLAHRLAPEAAGMEIGAAVEAVLKAPSARRGALDDIVFFRGAGEGASGGPARSPGAP